MAVSVSAPGEESDNTNKKSRKGRAEGGGVLGRVSAARDADAQRSASNGQNMTESVTRHVHVTEPPKDWRFLACGYDTMDLGVYVDWGRGYEDLLKTLLVKKNEAQGQNAVLWKDFDLGPCLMHAGGKAPNYRFHLQMPDYHFFLAAQQKGERMPNVYISPDAKTLWTKGVSGVRDDIMHFIGEMGGSVLRLQVSRVDLAADYLIPGGLTLDYLRSCMVPSNRKTIDYCDGPTLETFYAGSRRGKIQARIYDKALEVRRDGKKFWFLPIWGTLDACLDIWRVEFQVRRPILKQFGIDSTDDLLANGSALWKHLTSDWLSMRLPDANNTSRRTPCLWWQAVADLGLLFGPASDVIRQTDNTAIAPVEWYVSHTSGCLASYAARKSIPKIKDAVLALTSEMEAYWSFRDWPGTYAKKSIELGFFGDEKEDCNVPI